MCNEINDMCIYDCYIIQENKRFFRKPPLLGPPLSLPDTRKRTKHYWQGLRSHGGLSSAKGISEAEHQVPKTQSTRETYQKFDSCV